VCEDYAAIQCPVFAVGGWTDGYTNAIPRLLQNLTVPRKGLVGPWAHAYPHFARPGPQIGFLQEALRWWDHWLKGIDTGVMNEPMLRAWMTESVRPAADHDELPGRWIAEASWPAQGIRAHRLVFSDSGLRSHDVALTPRTVCSPQTVGRHAGSWCPFGRGGDQADDQREDDARSLAFETEPLDAPIEILGAAIVTLEIAADRPVALLAVRLCDVHPDGASLRVSYGILNLTHRDGHERPAPLVPGQRYRVRMQLNDAGSAFPAGHRIRIALSTTYWPMIWPAPEIATVTVFGGSLELPVRTPGALDALLSPLPAAETALPEPVTQVRDGTVRIDRLGLELGVKTSFGAHVDEDDPLSAMVEVQQTQTVSRDPWRVRIDTQMRMSCTRGMFLLRASMRACEGDVEVCSRTWDCSVPRNLV
jgi:hypothetical protein